MKDELGALRGKSIFFLDRDGTLTLGDQLLPGANQLLDTLRERGKLFYVLTNNSSKTPSEHFSRFKSLGMHVSPENVLVSIQAALAHMKQEGYREIFWVATAKQGQYIESSGFSYDETTPDALLLTYDTEITYQKLKKLTFLARKDIPYLATHPDIVCPTPEGSVPDIGTFIKVIEMATGRLPDEVFGKPSRSFIMPILEKHGLTMRNSVIVGDRLYTDIKLALDSPMTSVLVLTGETTKGMHEGSAIQADIVVDSLEQLLPHL